MLMMKTNYLYCCNLLLSGSSNAHFTDALLLPLNNKLQQ